MSTILVTGCAGLLGSHLARHLLDRGHVVVGVDDFSGGYREFVDPRVDLCALDLKDSASVDRVFVEKRPQFVYHLAAYATVGLSPFIRRHIYETNVVASANVVNACLNNDVEKVVFTSSMDVYGSHTPPFDESMIPRPEDPYGISKYAIEQDLAAAGRFFGLRHSIVRPHNVFGRYQNIWDRYRNVLGIWIRQTLEGKPITVYGDGSQVRSFSDVKCYMEPFEKLLTVGDGETYNMGADQHMTIKEAAIVFRSVAQRFMYNVEIVHLEARDEVALAYCDHAKAKAQLGFKDTTDFTTLVEDMFVWARNEVPRPVKTRPYEVTRGLYSYWR